MKYLIQASVIFGFTMLGELLHALLPLPIPAAIYGLLLLFLALCLGFVKLPQVKDASNFFQSIMSVLFVSPAVSLLESWDVFAQNLIPILVIVAVSTFLVFAVSGWITQALIRRKEGKHLG